MSSTPRSSDYVMIEYHIVTYGLLVVQMQEEAALHEQYTRVITPEPALNEETEDVCGLLKKCYDLRQGFTCPGVTQRNLPLTA